MTRSTPALILGLALVTSSLPSAQALDPEKHRAVSRRFFDAEDPESAVPTPQERDAHLMEFAYMLQDYSVIADKALAEEDYATAVKFYRALAKAVPNNATAFAKACKAYEGLREIDNALDYCRQALGKPKVKVGDSVRFIRLMTLKPKMSAEEREEVEDVLRHLESQKVDESVVREAECGYAIAIDDTERLARCSEALTRLKPNDPKTLTFRWYRARMDGNFEQAQAILVEAKEAGMDAASLNRLQTMTALAIKETTPAKKSYLWVPFAVLALALVAAALWFGRSQSASGSDAI